MRCASPVAVVASPRRKTPTINQMVELEKPLKTTEEEMTFGSNTMRSPPR